MRQAGRADPEYRKLRDRVHLPLEALFRSPEIAIEISLLPKRIGVDAIIFFQDILTPLAAMGAPFVFRPGPRLESPLRSVEDVKRLHGIDPAGDLAFVGETLAGLRKELEDHLPVLGFAGAPLTLLFFLVEGASPGPGSCAKAFLREEPVAAHRLLNLLAEMTVSYLRYQIESGAQAIQLFESTADLVSEEDYKIFALPYQRRVLEGLQGSVPRILFAKGWKGYSLMKESGAEVLSVSNHKRISEIRKEIGEETPLQGNVSNQTLAKGGRIEIETAVAHCIRSGENRGHILNLDHGVLPDTPWEHVEWFIEAAKKGENRSGSGE